MAAFSIFVRFRTPLHACRGPMLAVAFDIAPSDPVRRDQSGVRPCRMPFLRRMPANACYGIGLNCVRWPAVAAAPGVVPSPFPDHALLSATIADITIASSVTRVVWPEG